MDEWSPSDALHLCFQSKCWPLQAPFQFFHLENQTHGTFCGLLSDSTTRSEVGPQPTRGLSFYFLFYSGVYLEVYEDDMVELGRALVRIFQQRGVFHVIDLIGKISWTTVSGLESTKEIFCPPFFLLCWSSGVLAGQKVAQVCEACSVYEELPSPIFPFEVWPLITGSDKDSPCCVIDTRMNLCY